MIMKKVYTYIRIQMKRENTNNRRNSNRYRNEFKGACSLRVTRDNFFYDNDCDDDGGDIDW